MTKDQFEELTAELNGIHGLLDEIASYLGELVAATKSDDSDTR
jgi:hypothetical protein